LKSFKWKDRRVKHEEPQIKLHKAFNTADQSVFTLPDGWDIYSTDPHFSGRSVFYS